MFLSREAVGSAPWPRRCGPDVDCLQHAPGRAVSRPAPRHARNCVSVCTAAAHTAPPIAERRMAVSPHRLSSRHRLCAWHAALRAAGGARWSRCWSRDSNVPDGASTSGCAQDQVDALAAEAASLARAARQQQTRRACCAGPQAERWRVGRTEQLRARELLRASSGAKPTGADGAPPTRPSRRCSSRIPPPASTPGAPRLHGGSHQPGRSFSSSYFDAAQIPVSGIGGDGPVPAGARRPAGATRASWSLPLSLQGAGGRCPDLLSKAATRCPFSSKATAPGWRARCQRKRRGLASTWQRIIDLPGNTSSLRVDSIAGRPSLIPTSRSRCSANLARAGGVRWCCWWSTCGAAPRRGARGRGARLPQGDGGFARHRAARTRPERPHHLRQPGVLRDGRLQRRRIDGSRPPPYWPPELRRVRAAQSVRLGGAPFTVPGHASREGRTGFAVHAPRTARRFQS